MSPEDIAEEYATKLAGNWKQFESFAWYGGPFESESDARSSEEGDRWCIWNTHHRDSGLLDQSNAAVIRRELRRYTHGPNPSVTFESHSHWAVGWTDAVCIKVRTKRGRLTRAFHAFAQLLASLEYYPVLSDEEYSELEYNTTLETIEREGGRHVREGTPEDWAERLFSWFWDNDQSAVENSDDQGGRPSEEQYREGLSALGLLSPEYEE